MNSELQRPSATLRNAVIATVFAGACFASAADKATRPAPGGLKSALVLHASFDKGLDADFAAGDPKLYHTMTGNRTQSQPGLIEGQVVHAKGEGRFGDALRFTKKDKPVLFFRGDKNIGFRTNDWSGACSLWLRLNPDEDLKPGYCDPLQFVGGVWAQGAFFVEFSKDHTPREFRLGIMPITKLWNPDNRKYEEMPTPERPIVLVKTPPFSREKWTHIVFTFGNAQTGHKDGWGKLWLNGAPQGELKGWELSFAWKAEETALTLGPNYIGLMDDIAVFNRPLTDAEVKTIFNAKGGVAELVK